MVRRRNPNAPLVEGIKATASRQARDLRHSAQTCTGLRKGTSERHRSDTDRWAASPDRGHRARATAVLADSDDAVQTGVSTWARMRLVGRRVDRDRRRAIGGWTRALRTVRLRDRYEHDVSPRSHRRGAAAPASPPPMARQLQPRLASVVQATQNNASTLADARTLDMPDGRPQSLRTSLRLGCADVQRRWREHVDKPWRAR